MKKYLITLTILFIALGATANKFNKNDVNNPENEEYASEVAFNLDKKAKKVTQEEFDQRYSDFQLLVNKDTYYVYQLMDGNGFYTYSTYVVRQGHGFFIESSDLFKLKEILHII
jgi:hypothetical protein